MPRVKVESLSYGPHGVARVEGKVHFVRQVAPGDSIELAVREDHGAYAYGDLIELIERGPAHRQAPCPYLPRCGGCPWQHVQYEVQARAKEAIVRELLARIGGIPDAPVRPLIPAPAEYGYRRRLSLRVENGKVGYFAAASHDLVAVSDCLLGVPSLRVAIPHVQEWVSRLSTTLKRIELIAPAGGDGVVLYAGAQGRFAAADAAVTAAFVAAGAPVRGVVLHGRRWSRTWGEGRLQAALADGGEIEVRAGNFIQVTAAGNRILVDVVLEYAAPQAADRVLDLYAGTGNLSFPLARRVARVTAIERAAACAVDGRANARRLGLKNVTFVTGDAAGVLRQWVARHRVVDTVVLDPPRSGAAAAIPPLIELAPRRIVYVSCHPATLARDLRLLKQRYRVEAVQPIDFFPQTYHVETVVRLGLALKETAENREEEARI